MKINQKKFFQVISEAPLSKIKISPLGRIGSIGGTSIVAPFFKNEGGCENGSNVKEEKAGNVRCRKG